MSSAPATNFSESVENDGILRQSYLSRTVRVYTCTVRSVFSTYTIYYTYCTCLYEGTPCGSIPGSTKVLPYFEGGYGSSTDAVQLGSETRCSALVSWLVFQPKYCLNRKHKGTDVMVQ